MSTETSTVTHYGVARGEKLIGASTTNLITAKDALFVAEQQMIAVGLDPDLRLVEYDVETTVKSGRPRAYKEPADDAPSSEADTEPADS